MVKIIGGIGSGQWPRLGSKRVANRYKKIEIGKLMAGCYWGAKVYGNFVVLAYTVNDNPVECRIGLTKTDCNYGGSRRWFICPQCGRRVGVLYQVGQYYRCRHCHRLTYKSCVEKNDDRLIRKLGKIRKKLNCNEKTPLVPTIQLCDKPKGMHNKTYWRLIREAEKIEETLRMSISVKTSILGNRLAKLIQILRH